MTRLFVRSESVRGNRIVAGRKDDRCGQRFETTAVGQHTGIADGKVQVGDQRATISRTGPKFGSQISRQPVCPAIENTQLCNRDVEWTVKSGP